MCSSRSNMDKATAAWSSNHDLLRYPLAAGSAVLIPIVESLRLAVRPFAVRRSDIHDEAHDILVTHYHWAPHRRRARRARLHSADGGHRAFLQADLASVPDAKTNRGRQPMSDKRA